MNTENYSRTKNTSCFSVLSKTDLLRAYKKVKRGKKELSDKLYLRYKTELKNGLGKYYIDFTPLGDKNLEQLSTEYYTGLYSVSNYTAVVLPKPGGGSRIILVPQPRDRIIFSALLAKIKPKLLPEINHYNVFGSGKRSDYPNVKSIVTSVYNSSLEYKYVLKIDIKKFFPTINREILLKKLEPVIKDPVILDILEQSFNAKVDFKFGKVIDEEERNKIEASVKKGIPQGCSYSPLLANYYALDLDKKVRSMGTFPVYRYLDDMIVFTNTEQEARSIFSELEIEAKKLSLEIHPIEEKLKNKTYIQLTKQSFEYLGIEIKRNGSFSIPTNKLKNEVILIKTGIINPGIINKFKIERVFKTLVQHLKGWRDYYKNNFPLAYTKINNKNSPYNIALKKYYQGNKSLVRYLEKTKKISIDDPSLYL